MATSIKISLLLGGLGSWLFGGWGLLGLGLLGWGSCCLCFNLCWCLLDWCLFNWGSSGGSFGCFSFGSFSVYVSSFLFLDVFGKNLVILCLVVLGFLESVNLVSLVELLSSDSLFSDESLNLWWFVEGLVSLLDFSSHDILSNIILLSKGEYLSNITGSLGSESSWLLSISDTFDFSISLLGDSECDDGKIWSTDAASNWLSLSLSSSSGSVCCCSYFKIN